jgi:hypothetical protein
MVSHKKKSKRPRWWKKTREASKKASTDTKGNHLCCICGCLLGDVHREHHQPWKVSKEKFGVSAEVFNEAGPIADSCPSCNLKRTHETPVHECVLRNPAFLDRMKETCPGVSKNLIAKKLSDYLPYRDIEMGPETSYVAVEEWLANEFKEISPKKIF